MKYFLSLFSIALIGVLGFHLSTVSAVASNKVASGEKRIVVSKKVQILKLKRALIDEQKKMAVLKTQIAGLEKQIETKEKAGLTTKRLHARLLILTRDLAKIEKKIQEIKSQIDGLTVGTGSVM